MSRFPYMLAALLANAGWAAGPVQPGVFYHDPEAIDLELSAFRSGLLCTDDDDRDGVCTPAIKVVVTGGETCTTPDGNSYPCTRFGYEFVYSGAAPGTDIVCQVTRQDPMGREQSTDYRLTLDSAAGHVLFPTFRTFAPVEQRLVFSEAHACSYQGELLASIEYIIYYEPGSAGGPPPAGRYLAETPNACGAPHLTEARARGLLDATSVQPGAANEHLPKLQSQCSYGARQGSARQVGFVYKFMLSDMFDVDKLEPMQVQFNATFAVGGAELEQTRDEPGDRAFIFLKGDRSTLLVITGIDGPDDFAQRRRELIATYYLDHPGLTHAQRTGLLIDQAELDLRAWGLSAP